ncbi:MAG: hypothetical protein MUE81_14855, partial [Thermoflexibacter sp.]|nr:hypothetical protein [Thermoflexibacter sp.]
MSEEELEKFKQELLKLIDEVKINVFFARIDEEDKNISYSRPLFNEFRQKFMSGDKSFDFYDRLKAFVNGIKLKKDGNVKIVNNENPNNHVPIKWIIGVTLLLIVVVISYFHDNYSIKKCDTYIIKGIIRYEDSNKPVANTTVQVGLAEGRTDEKGIVEILGVKVPEGGSLEFSVKDKPYLKNISDYPPNYQNCVIEFKLFIEREPCSTYIAKGIILDSNNKPVVNTT